MNLKNCAHSILAEFKLSNLGLKHNQVEEFYQSQWQGGDRSWCYLIYRWIWAFIFSAIFLAILVLQLRDGKVFIFMTNWGIILCVVTHLIAAILVTRWHFNIGGVRDDNEKIAATYTPTLVKFYWVLHVVTSSIALTITTVYWAFLHGKMNKPVRFPVMSFITHCLNAVFMMVDFMIVAFPVRILHTAYAMILPITYFIFTAIYFVCDGTDEFGNPYVYAILDWKNPVRCIITFIGIFSLYVIFAFILFGLYKLKRYLHRTCSAADKPHVISIY